MVLSQSTHDKKIWTLLVVRDYVWSASADGSIKVWSLMV